MNLKEKSSIFSTKIIFVLITSVFFILFSTRIKSILVASTLYYTQQSIHEKIQNSLFRFAN